MVNIYMIQFTSALRYITTIFLLGLSFLLAGCHTEEKKKKVNSKITTAKTSYTQGSLSFTEVTAEKKLGGFSYDNGSYGEYFLPEIMGGGVAFIDYNQDHYQDILLVKGGGMKEGEEKSWDGLALYKNVSGKYFEEVTAEVGLSKVKAYGFGFTVGDYDNDGDDDFFMATLTHNRLFRNDDGKFTDVSESSGIYAKNAWSACALFVDADRDGLLDIFVGNYARWSRRKDRSLFCTENGRTDDYCSPDMYIGEPCSFYHNNGDGTFTEEAQKRGFHVNAPTKTLGIVEVDYNKDGWPDIFTANDAVPDLVFKNNGDGTYTETGMAMGVGFGVDGAPTAGMGAAVGDVRNDGSHAIFVGNFSKKMMTVLHCTEKGVYVNDAGPSQIGRQSLLTLNFGLSLFDADLDGDLDLFAANGHVFLSVEEKAKNITLKQRPHFFINDGQGKFEDAVAKNSSFFPDPMLARSTAYADFDLDGDLDLIITENSGPLHLMENRSAQANLLRLILSDKEGNTNAVGARVEVTYGNGQKQVRYVQSSDSYLSQSEYPITFGLADHKRVSSIEVVWPDGTKTQLPPTEANRFLRIRKGEDTYQEIKHFGNASGA